MEIQVALDPTLQIDAPTFISAWNEDAACREVARAAELDAGATQFADPALVGAALQVVGGLALGIAANILYDFFKEWLRGQGWDPETVEVVPIDEPGAYLVIVKQKKG